MYELLAVTFMCDPVTFDTSWSLRYHVNCRGMVDGTSHMKEANWPGNTEVFISPVMVSVGYKDVYGKIYTYNIM